ncbi:hypothetical protein Bhyg_08705 [Pseudolycoriella hygida]|uniref:HAT C-terminal dimerisation domain-containing protein n=1 Tax=Pseudolycoriella hygida TaxID=35572 RepID=A0A9Q0S576_9DIPT|nr:hypothetical protein Bhyg_08705 [Pseudolycoriella hygida]
MFKLILLLTIFAVTIARSVNNEESHSTSTESTFVNPTFIERPKSAGDKHSPIKSNSTESRNNGSNSEKSKIYLFDKFRPLLFTTPRPVFDNVTHVVIVAINSTVNYNAGIIQTVNNITAGMGPASRMSCTLCVWPIAALHHVADKILTLSAQPSFVNLSLFICQLFVSGKFRMVYILHFPDTFDDRWNGALHSTCPLQIPSMFIDITAPGAFHLNRNESTDQILQLIFLSHGHLIKHSTFFGRINELSTFYRVFVCSTSKDITFGLAFLKVLKRLVNVDSSSLLLIYNVVRDEITPHHFSTNLIGNLNVRQLRDIPRSKTEYLFDYALGEKAFTQLLGVAYVNGTTAAFKFIEMCANYFYMVMKLNYLDVAYWYTEPHAPTDVKIGHRFRKRTPRPIYKEFTNTAEMLDNETMQHVRMYPAVELHISYAGDRFDKKSIIYPYEMLPIQAIFLYGSDFSRQPTQQGFDIRNYWLLFVQIACGGIFLFILRRRDNIPSDFSINFLELHGIIYGGANIRAKHKYERIFFSIALIGSFFIISLILSFYSMRSIVFLRHEKVDSFAKVAQRDVDFYITHALTQHKDSIALMLKFVHSLGKDVDIIPEHLEIFWFSMQCRLMKLMNKWNECILCASSVWKHGVFGQSHEKKACVDRPEWLVNAARNGWEKLKKYYPTSDGLVHIVATDPRYKLVWYKAIGWPKQWIDNARRLVTELYKTKYLPTYSNKDLDNNGIQAKPTPPKTTDNTHHSLFGDLVSQQMSTYQRISANDDLKRYLAENVVDPDMLIKERTGINGVLGWWKIHEKEYPIVAAMAKDFLAISGTGIPVEEIFWFAVQADEVDEKME